MTIPAMAMSDPASSPFSHLHWEIPPFRTIFVVVPSSQNRPCSTAAAVLPPPETPNFSLSDFLCLQPFDNRNCCTITIFPWIFLAAPSASAVDFDDAHLLFLFECVIISTLQGSVRKNCYVHDYVRTKTSVMRFFFWLQDIFVSNLLR